jgi:5-methylcytosine-specific restriction endonuclease McrA
MPYVNKPRPYKHEYAMQQARGENPERAKRAAARREMDAKGINRGGKVIDHIKPLSKGGTNSPSNLKLTSREKNASFSRNSDHTVKRNVPKKK